jgi:integrase
MKEPISSDPSSQAAPTAKPNARKQRKRKPKKPPKPYEGFPLTAHGNGQWVKKIRGHQYSFGIWRDWQGALEKFNRTKDDLYAGRDPKSQQRNGGVTVDEVVNRFLVSKKEKMERGELSPHSYRDYERIGKLLIDALGRSTLAKNLAADDFRRLLAKTKTWGLVARGNLVNRTRVVFKWAYESEYIDKLPRYGPDFKRPKKADIVKAKLRKGTQIFTAEELRTILGGAKQPLRAMILLAINAGLGNADCGRLPLSCVDMDSGWINYYREKTGVPRRCPLWPETIEALKEAISLRLTPADPSLTDRVFITSTGGSWYKDTNDNPVSKEMAKILKKLKINGSRNFYSLRHTHRTIASKSKDKEACDFIMGHSPSDMSREYLHDIDNDRLEHVVAVVRKWLFEPSPAPATIPMRA